MANQKLAIDLGSAYTKIYMYGVGVVLCEPSVVAISTDGRNELRAVGNDAKKLIGKTAENTRTVFPIFEGEVVNVKLAGEMLKHFLNKIEYKSGLFGGSAIMSVPCGLEASAIKKLEKVANELGILDVSFIESPLLSAFGMQIPMSDFTPNFVIDMGGGTTNIAALSLDGIIAGVSLNYGGNKVDTNLIDYVADNYEVQIGILTAESLKIDVGALTENDMLAKYVSGREILTGKPKAVMIGANNILKPILDYYDRVIEVATDILSKLPPEVSAEINNRGVYLTGGMSKMYGIEEYFSKKIESNINVIMAEEPIISVALGGGEFLSKPELVKKLRIKEY